MFIWDTIHHNCRYTVQLESGNWRKTLDCGLRYRYTPVHRLYRCAVYRFLTTYFHYKTTRHCVHVCHKLTFSCQWLWQCKPLHRHMAAVWGWPPSLMLLLSLGTAGSWLPPAQSWPRWLSQWCCCLSPCRVWQKLAPEEPQRQLRNWSSVNGLTQYHTEQG